MNNRALSAEEALNKAEKYCAYQERCVSQVVSYLKKAGLTAPLMHNVIEKLIDTGFIDNQRFACAWVRGKLRNNGWGRIKLSMGLKALGIEDEVIKAALEEIDEEEYLVGLEQLLRKKLDTSVITPLPEREQHMKVMTWAYAKGYETGLIKEVLTNIKTENQKKNRGNEQY